MRRRRIYWPRSCFSEGAGLAFRSIGTNLTGAHRGEFSTLAENLSRLADLGADFVELWPEELGLIVAGRLDGARVSRMAEVFAEAGLSYTVHAPLETNLMDFRSGLPHREALEASLRFAGEVGADVMVCHAGQRHNVRDARVNPRSQLATEREALREAGDLAGELGVTIAVENYYPDLKVMRGEVYDYSLWPSELAEQVSDVDHPSVAVCLDTGHAALAAEALDFDLVEECAAAAPLVRHVHLHDNFRKVNPSGEPPVSESRVFGLGDLHLPPGMGEVPLAELLGSVEFPRNPSCCAELSDESPHLVEEALEGARKIAEPLREPVAF